MDVKCNPLEGLDIDVNSTSLVVRTTSLFNIVRGTCANQGMGFDLCSDCMEDGTKHPLDHIMLRIPGDVLQPVLDYATTGLAVVL